MAYIRSMIEHPIKIKDVMTSPVFTAAVDDLLYPTAQKMLEEVYTHVPIYDNRAFVGVLSESAILRWVGHRVGASKQLNASRKIAEVKNWLDVSGNMYNDYEFVPRNTIVLDVKKRFELALLEGRRLGAVFITKTGKADQPIEGIVTAWDFPKLSID